jgi:hypothetical protein
MMTTVQRSSGATIVRIRISSKKFAVVRKTGGRTAGFLWNKSECFLSSLAKRLSEANDLWTPQQIA